jgi:hypothetical protein
VTFCSPFGAPRVARRCPRRPFARAFGGSGLVALAASLAFVACESGADFQVGVPDAWPADAVGADVSPDRHAPPADTAPGGAADRFQGILDIPQEFTPPRDVFAIGDARPPRPLCQANDDGLLEAHELPALAAMGVVAAFTRNPFGSVVAVPDTGGVWDEGCACHRFDFRGARPEDHVIYDGVLPVDAFWFAAALPGGDFVQSYGDGVLGVYRLTDQALSLVGLASEAPGETAIAYDPPVPLLKLPLRLGDAWTALDTRVSGTFEGQRYPLDTGLTGVVSLSHSFQFQVDRAGFVALPAGEFPVWRVSVLLTMEVRNSLNPVPVATVRRVILLFLAECVGLVARVASRDGETATDFTFATEFRRLGLPALAEEAP